MPIEARWSRTPGGSVTSGLAIFDTMLAAKMLGRSAIGLAALPASLLAGILWQGVGRWGGLGPAAPFLAGSGLSLAAAILLARLPEAV